MLTTANMGKPYIPIGYSPASLYIYYNPFALHFFAICSLVRLLHIVLVLVLNEGIATRFACRAAVNASTSPDVAGP